MEKMTIMSPDYPKWYKANGVGCEWTIIAPKGNIISIEFMDFHVGYYLVSKYNLQLIHVCSALFLAI